MTGSSNLLFFQEEQHEGNQDGAAGRRAVRGDRGKRAERAVHAGAVLPGRALRCRRFRLLRRRDRLLVARQHDRRHQRREAQVGGVRDGIQRVQGRGVLRAAEEEPRRRHDGRAAVHRHRLRALRPRGAGQDSDDDVRLRPGQLRRRPRLSVGVPAGHDVLGPDGGDDRLPRPEGRRARQAEGQEDRVPVPRVGVRQGAHPGARCAGRQAGLRGAEDPGAGARPDAGIAMAADPPGQARLRDHVDVRRDEHRRAQDGRQDRLSARQAARRLVGGLGGGRDPGRRRREGLRQRGVLGVRHQFPGHAGHQDQGLWREEGQPRGSDAARQRDVHARLSLRDHHRRGASASRRPSTARAR